MRTSDLSTGSSNQFLRLLSSDDRALLSGKLSRTMIEPGALLLTVTDPISTIYFPESIIVSIETDVRGSRHETALVGYEGVVGWSALLGAENSSQRAIVQMRAGSVLGMSVGDIAAACDASKTLFFAFMRFIEVITVQMAHAIASHLRDTILCRVCRWLLMRHDRCQVDQLLVRHDEISGSLSWRRASVTDCLHILEGERLIRCHRGRLIIRDRHGLEQLAGDSYGVAEAQYRKLIGPFGRPQTDAITRDKPHAPLARLDV